MRWIEITFIQFIKCLFNAVKKNLETLQHYGNYTYVNGNLYLHELLKTKKLRTIALLK